MEQQAASSKRSVVDEVTRPGFFARLRIRKKLLVLHTLFSLTLALVMLLVLRPAVGGIVGEAERAEVMALATVLGKGPIETPVEVSPGLMIRQGDAVSLGLQNSEASRIEAASGDVVELERREGKARAGVLASGGVFVLVEARDERVRGAVDRLYALVTLALLGIYALVVLSLEVFVLPQHVYGPIRRLLRADEAVQAGDPEHEVIPDSMIPQDELGEIMRSRNRSIETIRAQERALKSAYGDLERAAADLKGKNHLLERARQNLADADRLANLGMMSAGIAHELNTPLAVLKGLTEKLVGPDGDLSESERRLMVRVIGRLEGLGESLLDFARVRPPESSLTALRGVVEEAITLVKLDRLPSEVEFVNGVPDDLVAWCDQSRIVQVFLNLIRNAVDAIQEDTPARGRVEIHAEEALREGGRWVSVKVRDDGPGIPPSVLNTIFEPFVSTRLDSRGTGLGMAVAEGIVREHGGVLLARNRDSGGAEIEMLLPLRQTGGSPALEEEGARIGE